MLRRTRQHPETMASLTNVIVAQSVPSFWSEADQNSPVSYWLAFAVLTPHSLILYLAANAQQQHLHSGPLGLVQACSGHLSGSFPTTMQSISSKQNEVFSMVPKFRMLRTLLDRSRARDGLLAVLHKQVGSGSHFLQKAGYVEAESPRTMALRAARRYRASCGSIRRSGISGRRRRVAQHRHNGCLTAFRLYTEEAIRHHQAW